MTVTETILNSKDTTNSDKLKAATILLDRALPSVENLKELEIASDPDYQIIESDRINLLMDKLSGLLENRGTLSGSEIATFEDVESTRKLLND
ncbi:MULTISPECIES: hypothetical protein [Cyanophyceae]|uniref:hypothetical protein n=1 Tax=Cyanophyceae TaxID=3028117 RepID=UPI0016845A4B|nr:MULTISPECIES: hypothetical protein [Cyanophyceae]MBD1917851.1 hypothetical protein [Phormidium sp. FACHB-77]MBD2032969.1 hypothetical protein [Phormidium sp. FACHB-322]MBD2051717.1 hypothetical protein [Leptolyngbya sp. FACHB-60]